MPRDYIHSNGRRTRRTSGGQFRRTTLKDFGIMDSDLQKTSVICAGCGYGQDEPWHPILKTGICPKCGSREKKQS